MPLISCVLVEEVVIIVVLLGTLPFVKRLLTLSAIIEAPCTTVVSVCSLILRLVIMIELALFSDLLFLGCSSNVVQPSEVHVRQNGVSCCDLFEVLFIVRF